MYLRLPRIFFFLLTSALCITESGLASWNLKVGLDQQQHAKKLLPGSHLNITDAFWVGGAVTAAAAVASTLCTTMLIYGILRPSKKPETLKTIRVKEAMFAFSIGFFIATLIPATIVLTTHSAKLTRPGLSAATIATLLKATHQNLAYTGQVSFVSSVAVGWCALASLIVSFILASIAARKTLKYGADGVATHHADGLEAAHHQHASHGVAFHSAVDEKEKAHGSIEHIEAKLSHTPSYL
ncbi:hypothetical protein JCM10908_007146 [Rhodotorula pacifica]|uniref:uncharacterized protein n=1 Tax=Rhodotorula pacifica TaxID=1495444 RepID=UPI00317F54D4